MSNVRRPSRAALTDLNGVEVGKAEVCGDKVAFEVGAHRIAQVKIYK